MSEEILINITPTESRVAVVENGVLQEVWLDRVSLYRYLGNVYKGTVSRVLPGMQAAFIDVGLERTAFLHASDIFRVTTEKVPTDEQGDSLSEQKPVKAVIPQINELVTQGSEVIVQVIKDPIGTKGARLTTNLSIPSRFLVLLPDCDTIGVSEHSAQSFVAPDFQRRSVAVMIRRAGAVVRSCVVGRRISAVVAHVSRLATRLGIMGAMTRWYRASLTSGELPNFVFKTRSKSILFDLEIVANLKVQPKSLACCEVAH